MWIRAVIIEDEPLAAQYLAALLDDTCQVEVVGTAAESEAGLRLCAARIAEKQTGVVTSLDKLTVEMKIDLKMR